jgi:hypothetical protein
MPAENRIHATLATADREKILAKADEIAALLPFLVDLTPEERRALPKMGDRSRSFVERSLEVARQDDSFLPRSFDVSHFESDVALYLALDGVRQRLASLLELVEDTQILAGSEAYLAALDLYHHAKRAGRGAGLDDLLDRVGKRFASHRSEEEK